MSEIGGLDSRVTRLESEISLGFQRIESLLRQEITDLKTDQISDLRKTNERLADDQRRLWDRVSAMELREHGRVGDYKGQSRVLGAIGHFLSAAAGGVITWLATWLSGGGGSPHHP
jgi:hypothetical protein